MSQPSPRPLSTARQAPAGAMQWASAVSDAPALEQAVTDAAQAVARTLGTATADLLIVFVSPHHAAHYRELPRLLRAALPHQVLLGCSAGGVIGGGREVEEPRLPPDRLDEVEDEVGVDAPERDARLVEVEPEGDELRRVADGRELLGHELRLEERVLLVGTRLVGQEIVEDRHAHGPRVYRRPGSEGAPGAQHCRPPVPPGRPGPYPIRPEALATIRRMSSR